jgi:hypothetical protein
MQSVSGDARPGRELQRRHPANGEHLRLMTASSVSAEGGPLKTKLSSARTATSWLEILKASGWQTAAIAIACGALLWVNHRGWLPPFDLWVVQ